MEVTKRRGLNTGQGSNAKQGYSADAAIAKFTDSSGQFDSAGWQKDAALRGGFMSQLGAGAVPAPAAGGTAGSGTTSNGNNAANGTNDTGNTTGGTNQAGNGTGGANGSTPVGSGTSTMQNLAMRTRTGGVDSELYTQQPGTTVREQLDANYANPNSLLMKRYAAQGAAKANARGLTNSTIAIQGGMGNVLDKAGEFATTDAKILSDRQTETVRSQTALEAANIGADASIYGTDSARATATQNNNAAAQRNDATIAGQKAINDLQIATEKRLAYNKNKSTEFMNTQDNETKLAMQELVNSEASSEGEAQRYADIDAAMAQAIANIDLTSSPASQSQQLKRIMDVAKIRKENYASYAAALGIQAAPAPASAQTNNLQSYADWKAAGGTIV